MYKNVIACCFLPVLILYANPDVNKVPQELLDLERALFSRHTIRLKKQSGSRESGNWRECDIRFTDTDIRVSTLTVSKGEAIWTETWSEGDKFSLFLRYSASIEGQIERKLPTFPAELLLSGQPNASVSIVETVEPAFSYRVGSPFLFGIIPGLAEQSIVAVMKSSPEILRKKVEFEGFQAIELSGNTSSGQLKMTVCPELNHRILSIELLLDNSKRWRGKPIRDSGFKTLKVSYRTEGFSKNGNRFTYTEASDIEYSDGRKKQASSSSTIELVGRDEMAFDDPPVELPNGLRIPLQDNPQIRLLWKDGRAIVGFSEDAVNNLKSTTFFQEPRTASRESTIIVFLLVFSMLAWFLSLRGSSHRKI